ncbi:pituitary tumor-transforming gene 1 protein-interacting protein [Rhinolophus sinicus]|uniref:pituitary tumor-transforming gene 1 protein-interacting protein n=1 Tax=Rhinolophus sinicus TaxID=89399 RepID=UPI003D7A15F4
MGSGGARAPTVRWGRPLGGAALLLLPLLLSAAAGQKSLGTACSQNTNRTCEECLKNVSCLWCNTDNACLDYPVTKILPPASLCKLSSARWGVCWVNFEALIIAMSVIGGILLLAIVTCCCCCCCRRKKRNRKPDRSEEKAMREQEERRVRQEERRAEMKSRHDEIRKKYGLFKEENPYARFENN